MDFEKYKNSKDGLKLLERLKRSLRARGFDITDFSDDALFDEIEDAILAVNDRRHFEPTETTLFENKYKGIVIKLCICSIAKMGAEGEIIHSENGIYRSYSDKSTILAEVVPLGRMKSI